MNQNNVTDDKKLEQSENLSDEHLVNETADKADQNTEEKNQTVADKADKVSENNHDDNAKSDAEKSGNETENELAKKDKEINELKEQLRRLAAEFDNYKKRTRKEKEKLYASSVVDVVSAFLPVADNVERALKASEGSDESIREGVAMIQRQIEDILSKLGVKPIEAKGKKFNPDLHEAVAHIDDENYGENEIVEEFLKGYIYKDETVIRHSVVKVAN